jgi:hypothetical protein
MPGSATRRVVLSGVAPIPWRSRGAAALRDNAWNIPLARAPVARALRQLV